MAKTYEKPSPLQIAVMKDNIEIVKYLLDHKADPNAMHGCFGSALHIALCTENAFQYEIVEMLLKYGANPNINGPDADGRMMKSPFVEFLRAKDDRVPNPKIVLLLLSYGGKIIGKQSQQDPRGQLRNIANLFHVAPEMADHLVTLMEETDKPSLDRLAHSESLPLETRNFLIEKTR